MALTADRRQWVPHTVQAREQFHYDVISERVTQNSQAVQARVSQLSGFFMSHGSDASLAHQQAFARLAGQVRQEAIVMSFSDAFAALAFLLAASLLVISILPRPERGLRPAGEAAAAH